MEKILSPLEINRLMEQIRAQGCQQSISLSDSADLQQSLEIFTSRWAETYTRFEQNPAGELAYRDIILYFTENVLPKLRKHLSENRADRHAVTCIENMLYPVDAVRNRSRFLPLKRHRYRKFADMPKHFVCPEFDRPIFIVSAPRAGSTLLFETLSGFEDVWTIGQESHDIETDIPYLHPAAHKYESNRVTDATPEIAELVRRWFAAQLKNRENIFYTDAGEEERPGAVRFLEKTPKNALRIPFLKKVFPDALFIFLYRDPRENISSMLEGWRSRRFLAYRDMPGWPYREWRFLLPPGWQTLAERPLAEIAAYQWTAANQHILEDVKALPQKQWCFVTYNDLVEHPGETIRHISGFAGLKEDRNTMISGTLPLSSMVLSPPSRDKWRRHEAEIMAALHLTEPVVQQIRDVKFPS